ncbi:hypothetical protein DIZ81_07515 [Legionella taurinensis]|uniref:Dot/Icm T4SS effector n=1 Tax=Legionella taurinensis TaxID=70611 RepID=A0A3A5L609_9GAMM|nr:hypothetical protein [Legionella taurinensis]MDX1837079.1 hypothetical protein [Legionella taurinensis]PUT40434.1 hypothetical protein DB744_07515 [Legionella taurinensis]PUT40474.1 hypothetical protein DB746_11325 [Legionella taurinensis]PUT42719.1 hypothetical protein DB743_11810 [Legionella taurinensis]PUT48496.1 hypothetical protein DB745_05915 [Legionella taurinensis]
MALIRAISLDFDGAIFNDDFHRHKEVIRANKALLDLIATNAEGYDSTTLYAGTNRQSVSDDRANAYKNDTGSAFPHLMQLAAYLKDKLRKVKLDKFLLTDLYHQRKAGESFNEALSLLDKDNLHYDQEKMKNGPFKDWLHDQSKLTLLYAQIHRFAKQHPKDALDFYFYDDREDILEKLHAYFQQNPNRLPSNLCLRIKRYCGEGSLKDYPSIQGTGKLDKKYKATVKRLAADTLESVRFQQKSPANGKGRPIHTYKEAEESNFVLTVNLDCITDCQLLAAQQPLPVAAAASTQPTDGDLVLEKSASWHSFTKPATENDRSHLLRQRSVPHTSAQPPSEPSHGHPESSNQALQTENAGDNLAILTSALPAIPPVSISPVSEESLNAAEAAIPVSEEKKSEPIAWQFYRPATYPLPEKPLLRQTSSTTAIASPTRDENKRPAQFL